MRASVEDIGLADPQAVQALAAKDVYDFLGTPEGELALAQAVIYLATAPKSNAVYTAFGAAKRSAGEHGSLMPPAHILNAPTKLMKDLGYGAGYEYDHGTEDAFSGQNYFPDDMARENFYRPAPAASKRKSKSALPIGRSCAGASDQPRVGVCRDNRIKSRPWTHREGTMANKLWLGIAFAALCAMPVAGLNAQGSAPSAQAVLAAANIAMGGDKLKSLQYSATGYAGALGQAYAGNMDDTWPRFALKSYVRTIDYDSMSMKEEQVRVQGPWPATHGGGQRPIAGERRSTHLVSGKYAWDVNAQNAAVPQPSQAELRQLDIIMTPHGFIKAAMAARDATVSVQPENARSMKKVSIVSFKAFGKYPVNGWINEDHMINKVQTWLPNPVFGDMFVELRAQRGYKDYNGVKFPNEFHQSIGDPPSPGLDIQISDVKPNIAGLRCKCPMRCGRRPSSRSVSRRGRWRRACGCSAAPITAWRSSSRISLSSSKRPMTGAFAGGDRRDAPPDADQADPLSRQHASPFRSCRGFARIRGRRRADRHPGINFNYYEGVVFDLRPRIVQPDRLSIAPRQVHYLLVKDKRTITDGERSIMHMEALDHTDDMLMVWLPKEKIVVEADLYNPAPAGSAAASGQRLRT